MISADTNVVVRLLTGDDPFQFKRAKSLFSKETVLLTTSVILESEWVLRYAYHFNQPDITHSFRALFGLSNVRLKEPLVIHDAIEWHQQGMDFADAIHVAASQNSEAFVTFDKKLIKSAQKGFAFPVREP